MKIIKIKGFILLILIVAFIFSYKIIFSSKFKAIKINNIEILVEIADTSLKQAKGLSNRNFLKENRGMLFIFEKPNYYSFWMKEMNFPIDIIWIDENWQIVDITENILPQIFPKTFQPERLVKYVLEVKAGFVQKNKIKIGDKVNF